MLVGDRVQIPVDILLNLQNQQKVFKELENDLSNIFSTVDMTTPLARNLNRGLNQVRKRLNTNDSLLSQALFTDQDLKKFNTNARNVSDTIQELRQLTLHATPAQLGLDTKEIDKANEALSKLYKQINKEKSKGVALDLGLGNADLTTLANGAKVTGFKGGNSYNRNLATFDKNQGDLEARIATLNSDKLDLQPTLEQFEKNFLAINEIVKNQQKQLTAAAREIKNTERTIGIADQVSAVKGTNKRRSTDKVIADYTAILNAGIGKNGRFAQYGRQTAMQFGEWMGISQEDLKIMAKGTAQDFINALSTAMSEVIDVNGVQISRADLLKTNAAAFSVQGQQRLQVQQTDYEDKAQLLEEDLARRADAESELAGAQRAMDALDRKIKEAADTISLIEQHRKLLEDLQKKLNNKIDANYKTQTEAGEDAVRQATQRARASYDADLQQRAQEARDARGSIEADTQARNEQLRLQQERQNFKAQMESALKMWLSTQTIVNTIRDGLVQAARDIQQLDKAMANIAVVTDMSISDLWGKIDEYMSIAKQYGVTTQGVYEVSQLYYQQGLTTNEVMAATTETLKMARIAGMSYADAADAMTVA